MFDSQITFKLPTALRANLEAIQIVKSLPRLSDVIRDIFRAYLTEYITNHMSKDEQARFPGVLEAALKRKNLTDLIGKEGAKKPRK
jgi:metal-responsive CopG/Arc/MetJ family transcriptional regulator